MSRMKKCMVCGSLIQKHETKCAYCFMDDLNSKKIIERIIKEE